MKNNESLFPSCNKCGYIPIVKFIYNLRKTISKKYSKKGIHQPSGIDYKSHLIFQFVLTLSVFGCIVLADFSVYLSKFSILFVNTS